MMSRKINIIILSIFFFVFPSYAQESLGEFQEKFQDWSVFKVNRGDKVICYTASIPIIRGKNGDERGESYFLVTNIENDADEIGVSSGFYYDKDSNVELSFGSKKFYLFPYQDLAWANDKNEDIDIIKEMQKQPDMIISGTNSKGRVVADNYSLIGFAQSYEKMKEICKSE